MRAKCLSRPANGPCTGSCPGCMYPPSLQNKMAKHCPPGHLLQRRSQVQQQQGVRCRGLRRTVQSSVVGRPSTHELSTTARVRCSAPHAPHPDPATMQTCPGAGVHDTPWVHKHTDSAVVGWLSHRFKCLLTANGIRQAQHPANSHSPMVRTERRSCGKQALQLRRSRQGVPSVGMIQQPVWENGWKAAVVDHEALKCWGKLCETTAHCWASVVLLGHPQLCRWGKGPGALRQQRAGGSGAAGA